MQSTKAGGADLEGKESPRRTYDVLRASLNETQRRCEALNNDMLAQQEANAQLVNCDGLAMFCCGERALRHLG